MSDVSKQGYAKQRANIPSATLKWISPYELESESLQNLQQQNPDVIWSMGLDLSVARPASDPLPIRVPGRAIAIFGYALSSAFVQAANTGIEVAEPSAFVGCRVNFNRPENAFHLKHNRGFRGEFIQCFLYWPAQPNTGAKLVVYKYDADPWPTAESDNRFNSVEASRVVTPAAILSGIATITQVVAADSSRKCVTIENQGTGVVYLGDSNVTIAGGANPGQSLLPNQKCYFRNTDAFYVVSAASQSLAVAEEH